ncbi:MAG: CHASE3 domain-containing protein, partial [Acidobacteriota bacterium]|nr:CHASE3 domain-containing protein [Acidobacteriota bacterium]
MSSAKFKRTLTRAGVMPLVLIAVLAGVLFWQINYLLDTVRWVDHTDQVIAQANNIRTLLSDMESGQRGYLLTHNPQFLEPFTRALPEIDPSFERLSRLVSDNPPQVERLNEIRSLSILWRDFTRELMELRDEGGDYQALVNSGKGKKLMDSMRAQFAAFVQTEESLRDGRSRTAQWATKVVLMTGVGLTIMLGLLLAFLTRQKLVAMSQGYGRALAVTRQQAEALGKSEERFRLASLATKDTIWDWDLLTNEIWWNDNLPLMLGYGADELEKQLDTWLSLLHPDDAERVGHNAQQVIESGKPTWAQEYRLRRKDGSYAFVSDRAYVAQDAGGRSVRMVGSCADVTERRLSEEALKASEERYRRLVELSPETIAIHSEGVFRYINDAGAKLLGASGPNELIGKP